MKQAENTKIAEDAKAFIKKKKRDLIDKFADLEKFPPSEKPFSFFMAGSPGAGKTEFSKRLIESMMPTPIVRIDADEIKEFIPQYTGKNSDIVQGAASIAVDNLNYYALKHNQNLIMDGTFAHYGVARKNIMNCLNKKRQISVFYIYQDPVVAWDFTRKREKLEGRYVPKEAFIEAFFKAKENVQLIKEEFGEKIELNLIIKNDKNEDEEIKSNISSNIDDFAIIAYNKESLNTILC
ncbi:MAG: zeta toxin family protein [Candidatus Moranbacteria bacterium]|jgi:predicted ABC-type ATPase|nr:zeta toxin family protein [Candidatus Moranbacteria bacterium]